MSNVLVISTSLRAKSNSDILAERLIAGTKGAGHRAEAGGPAPRTEKQSIAEIGRVRICRDVLIPFS